jgi:hypothetical protein
MATITNPTSILTMVEEITSMPELQQEWLLKKRFIMVNHITDINTMVVITTTITTTIKK